MIFLVKGIQTKRNYGVQRAKVKNITYYLTIKSLLIPYHSALRLSIQRNIAYKGQKYSLFYKQRGTYFEVQSICCIATFCITIEYMYNQVCNSMYCKSYVMHNTDTCQNIFLLT